MDKWVGGKDRGVDGWVDRLQGGRWVNTWMDRWVGG